MNEVQKRSLLKAANAEQKKAINFFCPNTGCLSFLGKVSEEDYQAIVDGVVKAANTYQKAIDKIGMDEDDLKEIPPVTLVGYEYDGAYTRGNKTSKYSVTHLFFSSTQVYMYSVVFDIVTGSKKERTEEYFYKDITNFSTSTDSEMVDVLSSGCGAKWTKVNVEIQRFALIVPGDKFTCGTYGDIEDSVRAMKNKLREKKA